MDRERSGPGRLSARERKARLREHLAAGRLEAAASMAEEGHQVVGSLISLTYDAEPLIAWRAVEAAGLAAARVGARDPRAVRRYLRRLFWLITEESGGICWYAPQAMAEIARTDPHHEDFVPIIMNLINEMADEDLDHFRPGILWAIGRLGPLAGENIDDVLASLDAALSHPEAQVRGLAAWAMGTTGQGARVAIRPQLLDDEGPVRLYGGGTFTETTVSALAGEAAARSG
ncbi:MAG: hypothetical protein GWM90_05250 [Gemmatimonadetes bacterium]|nr:hypothetical protein [Gemmatimonadota bacterium]NIQ53141.1 hypothetical protein [Gemmatimonadota bacterium]NIU73288.1 hypothetical protein [Gammaproteobacteria bacterium]NIX43546.1 hypothetical protein [Gemmatimonadota bacterium]